MNHSSDLIYSFSKQDTHPPQFHNIIEVIKSEFELWTTKEREPISNEMFNSFNDFKTQTPTLGQKSKHRGRPLRPAEY